MSSKLRPATFQGARKPAEVPPRIAGIIQLRASNPVYEALLSGEIVPAQGIPAPLCRSSRQQIAGLVKGLFLLPTSTTHAVAVASAEPGYDIAPLASGAAECLSKLSSGRVCLIDADFVSAKARNNIGVCGRPGLGDVLRGKASLQDVLTRFAHNLWVLPVGTPAGYAEDHNMDTLTEIVVALRRESEYLLVQAPPLNDVNSAIVFAKLTDGLLLVVEANRTRRDLAQALKARLDAAGVSVLGAVLNNRTYPVPPTIYAKL